MSTLMFVLLACSVLAGASCTPGGSGRSDDERTGRGAEETPQALAVLRPLLGGDLPRSMRVLHFEQQSGVDDMLRAKLQMSRSDFESIAPRLPVTLDSMSQGAGRLGADTGAWDPHKTGGIRSGQAALGGARFINVGVAEHGDLVTLFVMEHGT